MGVFDDQAPTGYLVRDSASLPPPVQNDRNRGRDMSRCVGSPCGPLRKIPHGTHSGDPEVPCSGVFRNHAVPDIRVFIRQSVALPEICIVFWIVYLSRFLRLGLLETPQRERLVRFVATSILLYLRRVSAVEPRLALFLLSDSFSP